MMPQLDSELQELIYKLGDGPYAPAKVLVVAGVDHVRKAAHNYMPVSRMTRGGGTSSRAVAPSPQEGETARLPAATRDSCSVLPALWPTAWCSLPPRFSCRASIRQRKSVAPGKVTKLLGLPGVAVFDGTRVLNEATQCAMVAYQDTSVGNSSTSTSHRRIPQPGWPLQRRSTTA